MRDVCDRKRMTDQQYNETVTHFLRGLKVEYKIPGNLQSKRTMTNEGLGRVPKDNMFNITIDGKDKMISVDQYFSMIKKYKIQEQNLPCIQVRPKEKNTFVPPEVSEFLIKLLIICLCKINLYLCYEFLFFQLCEIEENQVKNYKLSEDQTREVVKTAATSTDKRKEKILNGVGSRKHFFNK